MLRLTTPLSLVLCSAFPVSIEQGYKSDHQANPTPTPKANPVADDLTLWLHNVGVKGRPVYMVSMSREVLHEKIHPIIFVFEPELCHYRQKHYQR